MTNSFDATKIHFSDFNIIKGSIDSPFSFDKENIENYNFNVDFDMSFNVDEKLVKTDFIVEISTQSNSKQKNEAEGMFHFAFVYYIEDLNQWVEVKNENEITVENILANALSAITYSTVRGILITRFQGTALENFILPIVNPNHLLKNNKK